MDLKSISSKSLNKDLAYLFGVYLTDGSICNNGWKGYNFSISAIDKEFVEQVLISIKRNIPNCNATVTNKPSRKRYWSDKKISNCRNQYSLHAGFSDLGSFFIEETGKKHHIPFIIWKVPLDVKKWFIAGVMDGNGYISYHTRTDGSIQWRIGVCSSSGWIYEFRKLLNSLGIKTNKVEIQKKERRVPVISFGIKIFDFKSNGLFFTINRKNERLKKYIETCSETKCRTS